MRRRLRGEDGFTLIELSIAVGLFGIIMIGLSVAFRTSFKTTNQARFDQIAKTLAQEKLEEVRSFPLFLSQRDETGDVDVLDRYFLDADATNDTTPDGAAGSYDGTSGVWAYTSTETVDRDDAPPFTRTVRVQFVKTASGGALEPVAPLGGYDSDALDLDQPSTDTVQVLVTVAWTQQGNPQSVSLDTVIAAVQQDAPSVEASGAFVGAQASGIAYRDGDDLGQNADVLATVASGRGTFREVADVNAEAFADAVEVVERNPATNVPLQLEGPEEGESGASVPNSTDGTVQADPAANLAAGSVSSINDPVSIIAEWANAAPAASAEARVSSSHTQNPESRAVAAANGFILNARDEDAAAHRVLALGNVGGTVEQRSTTTQTEVTVTVDICGGPPAGNPCSFAGLDPGAAIWAAPQFLDHPDFKGTLTIEELHVRVNARATGSTSSTDVDWSVVGLRVWDPDLLNTDTGELGAYGLPYTFGFDSDCGGWVDNSALCGPNRTDGKEDFENPNPVVIPEAYVGTDPQGNEATSLSIVAGVTVRDAAADASQGFSSASAAQKNILAIATRDDIAGAVELEPMLVGLGDADTSVSYVTHEH